MMRHVAYMPVLVALLVGMAASAYEPTVPPQGEVEVTAERMEFDRARQLLKAVGHVSVSYGGAKLEADSATVKKATWEVWATGHVVYTQTNTVWKGERLYCNFKQKRVCSPEESSLLVPPFRVQAENIERKPAGTLVGEHARVTTCNLEYPHAHYYIGASKVAIEPGDSVAANNMVFHFGGVPVMYLPYWKRTADGNGLSVQPGYSSRHGAFLLSAYEYELTDELDAATHLDYRTRRGVAEGQDFAWRDTAEQWNGDLKLYYANDEDPMGDDSTGLPLIDSERYRARLQHRHMLDDRTYLLSRFHYLSDQEVLDDFFRSEFRKEPQPENYVSLRRSGDGYTAGLTARDRLNDFFDSVSRMPEATLQFPIRQIGDTPFYYENRSAASYLEKKMAEGSEGSEYSAMRVDTEHTLSISRRIGFLNVVPRAGGRVTYYSDTRLDTAESEAGFIGIVTNIEAGATNIVTSNGTTILPGGGAATRVMPALGIGTSFKAFKVLTNPDKYNRGLRHVIEPYADYSFVPEPNLLPGEILQFDETDKLDKKNMVTFGARNKLQTRKQARPYDLADLNVWTDLNLDPDEGESSFETIETDNEIRMLESLALDFDGVYNLNDGGIETADIHLLAGRPDKTHADINYSLRGEESRLISGLLAYCPNASWTYSYGCRYELEESRLEEQNVWIQRNYDCMGVAAGFDNIPGYTRGDGTKRDDEYQFLLRLWLTAFPDKGIGSSERQMKATGYGLPISATEK